MATAARDVMVAAILAAAVEAVIELVIVVDYAAEVLPIRAGAERPRPCPALRCQRFARSC